MDGISALQPAFAIGSLLYYGNQIIGKSHPGTGRFWLPALVFLISLLEEEGKGILDYFGWCLAYIFVPGILSVSFICLSEERDTAGKQRKRAVGVVTGILSVSLFMSGCGAAVEPEKRMYPMALGVDASEEGICLTYGMPDLSESTGQEKRKKMAVPGFCRSVVLISPGLEKMYDQSQEKLLDMGHLQVLVMGRTLVEDGIWRMVLDYLKQEIFCGGRSLCV